MHPLLVRLPAGKSCPVSACDSQAFRAGVTVCDGLERTAKYAALLPSTLREGFGFDQPIGALIMSLTLLSIDQSLRLCILFVSSSFYLIFFCLLRRCLMSFDPHQSVEGLHSSRPTVCFFWFNGTNPRDCTIRVPKSGGVKNPFATRGRQLGNGTRNFGRRRL